MYVPILCCTQFIGPLKALHPFGDLLFVPILCCTQVVGPLKALHPFGDLLFVPILCCTQFVGPLKALHPFGDLFGLTFLGRIQLCCHYYSKYIHLVVYALLLTCNILCPPHSRMGAGNDCFIKESKRRQLVPYLPNILHRNSQMEMGELSQVQCKWVNSFVKKSLFFIPFDCMLCVCVYYSSCAEHTCLYSCSITWTLHRSFYK